MLQTTYLHSGWEFARADQIGRKVGFSDAEWLPAQVPGHVHLDLVINGVIADPFERMNELGCQWVDEHDWTYRTTFEWMPTDELPRRALRFEGLDTVCTVLLNGEVVAEHDNMFVALEVDVTDRLAAGENALEIRFRSAVKVGEERRAAYFAANGIAEDTERFDERPFVRKAQYMFGWDWGPRLVSCGIWRPVTLVEYAARLVDVHVTQERRDGDLIVLNIKSELDGEGTVVHHLEEVGARVGDGAFLLHRPVRWDPDHPLAFRLTSALLPPDADMEPFSMSLDEIEDDFERDAAEAIQLATLETDAHDLREQNIGIVETRLLREPDEFGESFEFEVNGRRIWARGANWIPDHSFPSIVDKARLRDRLEKSVDMGFNMLRIWGGGLYETDEFYDLCDELGILVWQDFPFACSYYPDDEAWQQVIRQEAEANVRRIRNHPCLALWCGNNENHEMHFNKWGDASKHPSYYYGSALYDGTLPQVVEALDPGRSYIASSPIGTPPAEKVVDAKRRGPNADHYGDQHNWDVWHGRGDWKHYTDSKGRFSSEYGFASSCSTALWAKTLGEQDWDPHSAAVRWHDKTGKGHDVFHGYVELHYPKPVTLEDWVYYSQLNQRDALRHGIEHYRRSEFCRGSLIWQLNDCWPVQSWAILDSDGTYKALAYELRRLYADLLISLERENDTVRVWAINDGPHDLGGLLNVRAIEVSTGNLLGEWEADFTIDADSRGVVIDFSVAGMAVPDVLLIAEAGEATAWQLLAEPKQARYAAPASLTISTHEEGYLRIECPTPVVDLMLTSDGDPSPFLDNFLTSEGGVLEVRCPKLPDTIEARSLAGEHRIRVTRSPI